MPDPNSYIMKGEPDTRPDRYKIQVFTHSGCMIELNKVFKCIQEAMGEASTITVNGLQGVLTAECMTFIPALQISSVSIEDTMKGFVPSVSITNLASIAGQTSLELEHKPESN